VISGVFTYAKTKSFSAAFQSAFITGSAVFLSAISAVGAVAIGVASLGSLAVSIQAGDFDGTDAAHAAALVVAMIATKAAVNYYIPPASAGPPVIPDPVMVFRVKAGEGTGLSGVWNSASNSVNLRPSSASTPLPPGYVPRRGGHGQVAAELEVTSGTTFGYGLSLLPDGTLVITWVSRTLNPGPSSQVPLQYRASIIKAVENTTGRTVIDGG
jgi:hypothetical protein